MEMMYLIKEVVGIINHNDNDENNDFNHNFLKFYNNANLSI